MARNPLALALVIVGSLAMAVAAFLPFHEAVGFHRIEKNTMMQNGSGWILVVLALVIAATGYGVSQGQSGKWWLPLIWCVVAAVFVIWIANDRKCAPSTRWAPTAALTLASQGSSQAWALRYTLRVLVSQRRPSVP
jgi:hypothetical protein